MKFTARGRKYEIDSNGVIVQTDHRPFTYDPNYAAIYDDPKYTENSNLLQAMRLGFAQGAHGKPIRSLFDVGYGNAAFINFAKKHVPFVYGYDITGVPLDGAYLMPELVKADVYTFWDVIEHYPDCSFIRDIQAETICVSLPYCHFHTEGLNWFENEYHHLKPDEHIRHFNPWSLRAFMKGYGWEAVAESDHEDLIRKSKIAKGEYSYSFVGRGVVDNMDGKHHLRNILSMAFKKI